MASTHTNQLLEKIKSRKAVVGILGMGYVGLPLALRFSEEGYPVVGFDIDPFKVSSLNEGRSYIKHFASDRVAKAVKDGFFATDKFDKATECDALIICVPTPLSKYRDPDLSFIVDTMKAIKPYLRKGHLVSLESTTYPGTTDEVLLPMMEEQGLKVGEDAFLVFSPEREDPGNPNFETKTIPKVCGGHTENCLKVGSALYSAVIDKVVEVSSTRTAEMTKLLENIQRAVNIGLMNEMKVVCEKMNLDVHEVIRAASTKPFGFTPYFPGPGLGGHCIPIDPFYLTWKAKEYGLNTKFIELAGEINTAMPQYVMEKIVEALNSRKKSVNGAKILVSGIAYKKNVDDMRESPAVHIMEMLRDRGAVLDYYDPYVPTFPKMREHKFELKSVNFDEATLSKYDCVVLTTDHANVDYKKMLEWAQLIVDTRGVYQTRNEKIVRA